MDAGCFGGHIGGVGQTRYFVADGLSMGVSTTKNKPGIYCKESENRNFLGIFFLEIFDFEYLKIDFETAKPLVDGEFDAGLIYQLFINRK